MNLVIKMDMIQSIGLAIVIYLIGKKIKNRFSILNKYSIPEPVIGGLLFAIITFIAREFNIVSFTFDTTLQEFFMILFFTSIGFNASIDILKKGGINILLFLLLAVGLLTMQNIVAISISYFLGINPLLGLMTGSTPMTGGHGTSVAISSLLENMGIVGASSVAIASSTFGLVASSMMGGPLAESLIKKNKLYDEIEKLEYKNINVEEYDVLKGEIHELNAERFAKAFFVILISMALGSYLSILFAKTGLVFPKYIGPMFIAAIIRNISDNSKIININIEEIKVLENVSLTLFLSMALMSLKLWELVDLALPMFILLLGQVILLYLYVKYITFNVMGKNYDSVVISAGHCGFGMGATPNAMTNMKTITDKYAYSKIALFVVPLVGALFIDFFNILIITTFIQFFN